MEFCGDFLKTCLIGRSDYLLWPICYESNQLSFISLNIAITVVLISSHEQNRAFFFSVCVQYIVHTIAQGSKNLEKSPINNCVRSRYFIFRWKFLFLRKTLFSMNQAILDFFSHDPSPWINVNAEVEKGKSIKKRAALFFLPLLRSMLRTIRDPDFFGSIWLLALWFSRIYYNLHWNGTVKFDGKCYGSDVFIYSSLGHTKWFVCVRTYLPRFKTFYKIHKFTEDTLKRFCVWWWSKY